MKSLGMIIVIIFISKKVAIFTVNNIFIDYKILEQFQVGSIVLKVSELNGFKVFKYIT